MTEDANYLEVNRANWDARAPLHAASPDYRLDAFRADPAHLSDVVRFDLPRLGDSRDQLAAHCDLVVAVVPATVAGVASSIRAVAGLEDPTRAGLVLRGRGTDELAAQRATGLPVLATMVSQRGMDEAVDLGLGPVRSFRGPLGRAAGDVLDRLRLAGRAAA